MTQPTQIAQPANVSTVQRGEEARCSRMLPVELIRGILSAEGNHRIQVCATGAAIDLISDLLRLMSSVGQATGCSRRYWTSQDTERAEISSGNSWGSSISARQRPQLVQGKHPLSVEVDG